MVHLAHGEGESLMSYGDAQQGAGTRHGIVGSLLAEILQRGQCLGAGLYLVEYEQRGLWADRHVGEKGQLLDDTVRILATLEYLGNAGLLVQAEIGTMFKAGVSKMSFKDVMIVRSIILAMYGKCVNLHTLGMNFVQSYTFSALPRLCEGRKLPDSGQK